ncbi:MAG: hypothetical protein ACYDGR_17305 [Candidatus Dormibacteria bacterium]
MNAVAIVRAGLGLSLEPPAFSAEGVRRATSQLLNERGFGDRSRQVANEIGAMPTPDAVVQVLERLIR